MITGISLGIDAALFWLTFWRINSIQIAVLFGTFASGTAILNGMAVPFSLPEESENGRCRQLQSHA